MLSHRNAGRKGVAQHVCVPHNKPMPTDHEKHVRTKGATHDKAQARADQTRKALHEAIRQAGAAGLTSRELASFSGLTYERVRQILR